MEHWRDKRMLVSVAAFALMGPAIVLLISFSGRFNGPGGGSVGLSMLSVFALVTAFSGANDVAMDAMSGERERKSLVPLLIAPVTAGEVFAGKWVAATIFGALAIGINFIGLVLALLAIGSGLLAELQDHLLASMVFGLWPLCLFGTALALFVSLRCGTMREASAQLRILSFVPMCIGILLVFYPQLVQSGWTLLPVIGQQTVMTTVTTSTSTYFDLLGVCVSTVALACAAAFVGARQLSRSEFLVM